MLLLQKDNLFVARCDIITSSLSFMCKISDSNLIQQFTVCNFWSFKCLLMKDIYEDLQCHTVPCDNAVSKCGSDNPDFFRMYRRKLECPLCTEDRTLENNI